MASGGEEEQRGRHSNVSVVSTPRDQPHFGRVDGEVRAKDGVRDGHHFDLEREWHRRGRDQEIRGDLYILSSL